MEVTTLDPSTEPEEIASIHGKSSSSLKLLTVLSKLTLRIAVSIFRLCGFINSMPFCPESKDSLRVRKFERRYKLVAWHLANWLYCFVAAFQLVTYIMTLASDETKGSAFAVHTVYLMDCLFGLIFMLSVYMKPDECILMLNQHDDLLHRIKELGVEVPKWSSHTYVILTANYMAYAMASTWLMQVCLFPVNPHLSFYLYSYLPASSQTTTTLIICWLYECTWPMLGMSTVTAFYFYWCADIFTFNSALAALLKKREWTENDLKAYKYLQIFCGTFNEFNGSFFNVGFTCSLVLLPIVYIYITLTLQGLNFMVMIIIPGFAFFNIILIVIFLPQHSKVRILSQDLLKAMKQGSKLTIGAEAGQGSTIRNLGIEKFRQSKQIMGFHPLGIRIWFFGICTLGTSDALMEQLFSNVLLLMSL